MAASAINRFISETSSFQPISQFHTPMPKYVKLILACLLCLAVITGLVLLVRHLF